MKLRMSRKASMQLSINAIVILVMAMAVLGLGLGLVRGLLTGGVGQLEDAIGGIDLTEEATSGKPLANINNLQIKRGSEEPIVVSFYNTADECTKTDLEDNSAEVIIECQSKDDTGTFELLDQSLPVNAPQGRATKLGGLANFDGAVGTYACTVSIACGGPEGSPNIVRSEAAFIEVVN